VHPALVVGFALAVAPLALTPGTSFALTLSYARHGPRAVGSVIVGTGLGTFSHATLAAVGLAAVVMRSAQLYRAIQLAGAIYLIILGISLLRSVNRRRSKPAARLDLAHGRGPLFTAYISNVLNPKAAGIYLTLAPQFIPAHNMDLKAMECLAATHVVVMALWLSCVGFTLSAVARRIDIERALRAIQRAGAVVLIALGIRTSTEAPV
jgi:threonine/homoserine/homoserine lactone efflux protein